jgi:hypothetical protein
MGSALADRVQLPARTCEASKGRLLNSPSGILPREALSNKRPFGFAMHYMAE